MAAAFLHERLKASLLAVAMLLAFVIIPYLFWHGAWFGRPLTAPELDQYLSDTEKPRHLQHALAQIADRIETGDPQVQRWYQSTSELASHPSPQIRVMLAWTLGHDPTSGLFHATLQELLQDENFLVRRNAALSLVRFGDASGLEELRAMLLPYSVTTPVRGPIRYLVKEGEPVEPGTSVFEVSSAEAEGEKVQVLLGGRVKRLLFSSGSIANQGDPVLVLTPDPGHVWESLRALALVGGPQELPLVEAVLRDESMSQPVRTQAELTRKALRENGETPR